MHGSVSSSLFDGFRLHGFASIAIATCIPLSALALLLEKRRVSDEMLKATTQEGVSMREGIQRNLGVRMRGGNIMAKYLSVASLAVLVFSALLASPISSVQASADPVVYTVGTTGVVDTFNPMSMMSGLSWTIAPFMYERLTGEAPGTYEPIPMLAQSWETSADGKVWTFHLAQNSVFHDNVPVTAEDVTFTYNLIIDNPDQCGLYSGYIQNITEVVAVDDYTVRFTTDVPKATMLTMWVPILPKHLWELVPITQIPGLDMWDTDYFPDGPIGSGPAILDSYDKTLGYVGLLKWDKYHIDVFNIDEILFVCFNNEDSMMSALYSGSIDVALYVPTNLWDTTLEYPNIDGAATNQFMFHELGFNCAPPEMRFAVDENGKPLFPKASKNVETSNPAVRQAIAMAIDKKQLVDELMSGLADKGDTIIPPVTPFWKYAVPDDEEWKFNLDKANALLDSAGYTADEDRDGIRENASTGAELDFTFYYTPTIPAEGLAAQKISKWLLEIGINAPAEQVTEMNMYLITIGMEEDMYIWNWLLDVDPSFILSVMSSYEIPEDAKDMSAWSDCMYCNPDYDALYTEQGMAVDITERQTIIREMQRLLYHDSPYVVLWYPYALYAYRTDEFTNFPDFQTEAAPDTPWFYYYITPIGEVPENAPPIVNAGPDMVAYQGETVSFTGNATDPDNPISDLTWLWTFEEPDQTISERSGRTVSYTFDNLGEVNVTVTVTDPEGLFDTDGLVVTVEPVPANAGWLVGYVDGAGVPVVGAVVSAGDRYKSTDVNGFFNLTLVAGTYAVNVSAAGYGSATGSATITVQSETLLNFTLIAIAWTLNGHVYDASTGDSIAGATVNLLSANVSVASIRTNATGYYEILQIPFGTYTVRVSITGYESNETTLTISAPGTYVEDFELIPSADIEDKGLSTAAIGGIVVVTIVAVAAAAAYALRKRKKEPAPPPQEP